MFRWLNYEKSKMLENDRRIAFRNKKKKGHITSRTEAETDTDIQR